MTSSWEEYQRGEEMKALGEVAQENLKAILEDHGCETVGTLARNAYKYTDCGAALSVTLDGGEEVYGGALRELPYDAPITAISVSSIVEGAEQTTEEHTVNLLDEAYETPAMAAAAYNAALEAVEAEASEIWNQSHGCPACAEHFGNVTEGDDGMTPVWPECPECGGEGSIL